MSRPLTESQLAQIFAPAQLGLNQRTSWDRLERSCQRLIDHYTVAGAYNASGLTLAIVCKQLVREVRDLNERFGGLP